MNKTEVIETLHAIDALPTLPIVAQQILNLIASPSSDMEQIAGVITRDQAITAKVIKIINSAFYGFRNRISSIQHAIVILGLNTVKNLVLGVSVVKTFEENAKASIFNRERFWLHAFSTALAAKRIAQKLGRDNFEDYFLAGLLHDIGILVIDQFFHDLFLEILNRSIQEKTGYLEIEKDVLGLHHGDIGGFLGERWNLPYFLLHAMIYHHSMKYIPPEAIENKEIIGLTHIADITSVAMGFGTFIENYNPTRDQDTFQKIAPSDDVLKEIGLQVKQETNGLIREWGL